MTDTVKNVNYTQDQINSMVGAYTGGATVAEIAAQMGKTARSVIAKLAQLGVYKADEKVKAKASMTKAEMVAAMAAKVELDVAVLKTLEKADKAALEALMGKL